MIMDVTCRYCRNFDELEFENACFLFELLEDNIAADVLVELEDDLRRTLKIHSPKKSPKNLSIIWIQMMLPTSFPNYREQKASTITP